MATGRKMGLFQMRRFGRFRNISSGFDHERVQASRAD
jgi:hypothetical protein